MAPPRLHRRSHLRMVHLQPPRVSLTKPRPVVTVYDGAMIIFGHCTSERRETGGTFACPTCQTESAYSMRRTYNYFSLYFIPVWRLDLVAEGVECNSCRGLF